MLKKPFFVVLLALALPAWAVGPGTDLWIPSVGHGPGQFGSQWRTDVWVSRPSGSEAAIVDIYFLPRSDSNSWPADSRRITVNPGETREFLDIVKDLFGRDNAFGALRFVATQEIVVTSRIYSAGLTVVDPVTREQKTGSAGQFFAALPVGAAIRRGQATDIQGVGQDAGTRTNVGWVEVTGNPCAIEVQRLDGNGTSLSSKSYDVGAYAVVQKSSILNELGGGGSNQRLRVRVVSGDCGILAFGSRLDNNTNDPSTIEMRTAPAVNRERGVFVGSLFSSNAPFGGLRFTVAEDGVVSFFGNGAVDCGGVPFILDFGPSGNAAPVSPEGNFTLALDHDYYDGNTKVLAVSWAISGHLASDGTASGAVTGTVTFKGTGDWQTCTGLTQPWKAAWTEP